MDRSKLFFAILYRLKIFTYKETHIVSVFLRRCVSVDKGDGDCDKIEDDIELWSDPYREHKYVGEMGSQPSQERPNTNTHTH